MKVRGFLALLLGLILSVNAHAAPRNVPVLTEISFKNATINETFSPDQYEYTLTLKDAKIPPTLDAYAVEGDAHLFINYIVDEANHQTGIAATVEYESGSAIYHFYYTNAAVYEKNDENRLLSLTGHFAEVYPKLNRNMKHYRLYIPKDMTVLKLTATPADIGAYCDIPKEIIVGPEQEPSILVTVTSSSGKKRVYTFDVKRADVTENEVRARAAGGHFSYADELLFYRNPVFITACVSAALGALVVAALVYYIKRLTVRVEDGDEQEFFDTV